MIKFFRNIRKNMLFESLPDGGSQAGKMANYLKYAIGEIILVMIGILLALQVNNWNESNKINHIVNNYLKELSTEIGNNVKYLSYLKDNLNSDLESTHLYLGKLNTKIPDSVPDSVINNLIGKIGPINWVTMASSTLEDFNSSGYINAIKDDGLKENVFRIQSLINFFKKRDEEISDTWKNQLLRYYSEHANIIKMRDSIAQFRLPETFTQHDRSAFINSRDFNNILVNRMMMTMRSIGSFEDIIKKLENISTQITNYIHTHDKDL